MAVFKDIKNSGLVFVKGHLLLKKRNRNIKFYAKEKGNSPHSTGE
jgi:hypothetical protein